MSGSNPFRRDRRFTKDATTASLSQRDDNADASLRFPPLTIETSSARTIPQPKHVQFASPPAPDTPLSYSYPSSSPSSPESFRYVARSGSSHRVPTGLNRPGNTDPFRSEDSDKDSEGADAGLFRYASTESGAASAPTINDAAGRLARTQGDSSYSTRPFGQSSADGGSKPFTTISQESGKGKQAMDVDAFTKLLLTGGSHKTAPNEAMSSILIPQPLNIGDSSSSNADSASVSRQSIFEHIPAPSTETPRTSQELDPEDADDERRGLVNTVSQARQKPSVPKTRHGKLLSKSVPAADPAISPAGEEATSPTLFANQGAVATASTDLNKPLPPPPNDKSPVPTQFMDPSLLVTSEAPVKRPPPPPLARRQSQMQGSKPELARSGSWKPPDGKDIASSPSPNLPLASPVAKAPPPPPTRRLHRSSTYGAVPSETSPSIEESSQELSTEQLAGSAGGLGTISAMSSVMARPSRTSSSASTASVATTTTGGPPPPPPPRRMRGFSKSSIDSQRPAVSELRRPSTESSRKASGGSNAADILANLAALQREVDALRSNSEPGGAGT